LKVKPDCLGNKVFSIPKEETKFVELITSIYENKKKQKDIKKYEDKINLMVYKLYDLTKEEIEIIENETA